MGVHRFWHGPASMYRADREGTQRTNESVLWPLKTQQTGPAGKKKNKKTKQAKELN